jgi:hypothetical protein
MHRRRAAQDDHLLRLIRQAEEARRWLRERLTGAAEAPAAVREGVAGAVRALLGTDAALVSVVDARTAVGVVGDPGRVAAWAALLELDAEAAAADGQPTAAQGRRARAAALRAAGEAEWGPAEPAGGDHPSGG